MQPEQNIANGNLHSYQSLEKRIKIFQQELERRKKMKEEARTKRSEELAQLQQDYQQRSNSMISKMEELKRKETLLITLKKIEPQVPQSFPKNYFCQLVYEDTLLTGSQKFTDFDQNIIEEKFVLPLLFSSIVKVQVWSAEEQPIIWGKAEINLQKDIEEALISQACEGSLSFKNETVELTYRLQLQGIGFSTWLRNIVQMRELEAEKAFSREQGALKKQQMRARITEKKQKFQQKFQRKGKQSTNEYNPDSMDKLLEELKIE